MLHTSQTARNGNRITRLLRRSLVAGTALTVLASGSALADISIGSEEDVTPPTVSDVSITPLSVDVTDGQNKTFQLTLTASDDLSGVSSFSVHYSGPAGNRISFGLQRTSGDANSGTWKGAATVTPLTANGLYGLGYIYVRDVVGNYTYYRTADNVAPAQLEVVSNADVVAPVMTAIRTSPNPADVSEKHVNVAVEVDVTDDSSGLLYAQAWYRSPSGRQTAYATAQPDENGVARGPLYLTRYSEPGEWKLTSLCAWDQARNSTCVSSTSTTVAGVTMPLIVTADPADLAKPTITAYRMSPGTIDVTDGPQRVNVEFDVEDALSGVYSAYIDFVSPRTAGASPEQILRSASGSAPITTYSSINGVWTRGENDSGRLRKGTLKGSALFPRYDRSGDWQVQRVCVTDHVNWRQCYSNQDLADIGPSTLTVKWNRTPNVTINGVTEPTYSTGEEPTSTCSATDVEDGDLTSTARMTTTGPDVDGKVTITCSATDSGGLTGTTTVTYIAEKRPNVAPTLAGHPVSGPDGENGWYVTDVTIRWTAEDADGNLDSATIPGDDTLGTDGIDLATSATVSDLEGLTASATSAPPVDIDKTPPVVTFTGNAGSYALTHTIAIDCAASDATSGIAAEACTPVSGPAWRYPTGGRASATATDAAGHVTEATSAFTVTVDKTGVCALLTQFSAKEGIAKSLCSELDNAAAAEVRGNTEAAEGLRNAAIKEISAQSGQAFTAEQVVILTNLVRLL